METVKVDFQKLQQLNDRIAQTIDALNQLRLSTHGLQHSAPGIPQVQGQQLTPQQTVGMGFGQQPQLGVQQPQLGAQQPQLGVQQPQLGAQFAPGIGQQQVPGQALPGMGISHSMSMTDPYWQIRAAQAFPFAAHGYPPVVSY